MLQVAPNYASYGAINRAGGGGGNFVNRIQFLSGNFDVGFDGDLLLAGIAAGAAAFYFAIYGAITSGRKKRSDRISGGFGILPEWLSGKEGVHGQLACLLNTNL